MAGTISKRVEAFEAGKTFIIPQVKVKWAKLAEVDRKYEPMWSVDIILTPKQAEEFAEVGFNVKVDKDGDSYLKAKRKEVTRAGKKQDPPRVTVADGSAFSGTGVGNGSTLNVEVYAKYGEVRGNEYLSCYLNGVEVVDLIAFGSKENTDIPF